MAHHRFMSSSSAMMALFMAPRKAAGRHWEVRFIASLNLVNLQLWRRSTLRVAEADRKQAFFREPTVCFTGRLCMAAQTALERSSPSRLTVHWRFRFPAAAPLEG